MRMRNLTTDVAAVRKLYQSESAVTLDYRVRSFNEKIGQTLIVDLGQEVEAGDTVTVAVWYKTSPNGTAFSWLRAEQTAGGKMPYVYTQCEDINCRTVAPM